MSLLVLLHFTVFVKAQYIDTVQVNSSRTYQILGGQPLSTFTWYVDDVQLKFTNDTATIFWSKAGTYNLKVIEHSISGCSGELFTYMVLVNEPELSEIDIPNVFTPNEDGINDYFKIKSKEPLTKFEISIYTRWGTKVFETHDINYSWDGRSNGEFCNPGVYYYVGFYQIGTTQKAIKGFLHLFR